MTLALTAGRVIEPVDTLDHTVESFEQPAHKHSATRTRAQAAGAHVKDGNQFDRRAQDRGWRPRGASCGMAGRARVAVPDIRQIKAGLGEGHSARGPYGMDQSRLAMSEQTGMISGPTVGKA